MMQKKGQQNNSLKLLDIKMYQPPAGISIGAGIFPADGALLPI
jgi:hypothetical protein